MSRSWPLLLKMSRQPPHQHRNSCTNAKPNASVLNFLGKYTEVELLNKRPSGFGWAILVQDNWEGKRQKVIKLPNREDANRELLAEAEILTKISEYVRHPNLIELKSVERYVIEWQGRKEERWFLVLAYGGTSLRDRLGRLGMKSDGAEYVYTGGKPLPLDEVMRIATHTADGLRALHQFQIEEAPGQHIIHRDIKPENILIDAAGTARLADFGISRVVERLTQSITVMGTPPYLPPEYARGSLHAMSDIYALGIVLYEMATGAFPFRTVQDKFFEMPRPAHEVHSGVPPGLSDVIQRCLWWDPNAPRDQSQWQRYQTAAELFQDLQKAYRRIYPVPPRYAKIRKDDAYTIYSDAELRSEVRIVLYPTDQSRLAVSRVLPLVTSKVVDAILPLDAFESDGTLGVVVPLAPSIAAGLAGRPPQSVEDWECVAQAAIRLCAQVARLHHLGIYHGLLHPGCIYRDGDGWLMDEVWLGQLVGVTRGEQVLASRGAVVGYAAPEILAWRMPPTLASDIYGIAAVLYGEITGQPPLAPAVALEMVRDGNRLALRTVSGMRKKAPGISRRLEAILSKALHADPAQRHRSLDQLIEELAKCRWPADSVETLVGDSRDAQKLGRTVEAYELLDQALLLDPGSPLVHHVRAEVYFWEGEPKWALKENAKAMAVEPTEPVLLLHGQCLMALGRYDEAEEWIREGAGQEDSSQGRHCSPSAWKSWPDHASDCPAGRLWQLPRRRATRL
jgi:serine/threonine protein kinase